MTVRLIEWQVPYTWGTAIEITPDKVINLLLRAENNLLHVNDDNELYCDLQLDSWILPDATFPVGVTTGRVLADDGRFQTGTLLRYQTTSWDYCQWLYGNDWNLYFDGWAGTWKQVLYSDQIMTILLDYIKRVDFNFVNKTGQTNVILDLSTAISPTADFTVNAPTDLQDWYVYLLRVSNGVSPYTMTLWADISNPRNVDLTLTPNGEDMFAFLAVGWLLELQPEIDIKDEAYWSSWDWQTTLAPSMNVLYDQFEAVDDKIDTKQDILIAWDNIDIAADWKTISVPNLNTKTFYLANTSDLTTAQAAYDWYLAGKNPIIIFNGFTYLNTWYESTRLWFRSEINWNYVSGGGNSELRYRWVSFELNGDVVQSIHNTWATPISWTKFLTTDVDYTNPYTPTYPWSPATKKYVDDHIFNIPVYSYHGDFNAVDFNVLEDWDYRIVVTWYHSWNINRTTTISVDTTPVVTYTSTVIQTFTYQYVVSSVTAWSVIQIAKDSSTAFEYYDLYVEKVNIQSWYLTATVS